MSELAERERVRKQGWAAPGGTHDVLVRFLKVALPAAIGVLLAYLALAPLSKTQEISFILDKNKVEVAKERIRDGEAFQIVVSQRREAAWLLGITCRCPARRRIAARRPGCAGPR